MSKLLVIRGDSLNRKRIEQVFKSFGCSTGEWDFSDKSLIYMLTSMGRIYSIGSKPIHELDNNTMEYYRIEEFLSEFKFDLGDRVIFDQKTYIITRLLWDEDLCEVKYELKGPNNDIRRTTVEFLKDPYCIELPDGD